MRDSEFWWTNTETFASPPYTSSTESDGSIHFRGKLTYDDGDLGKIHLWIQSMV